MISARKSEMLGFELKASPLWQLGLLASSTPFATGRPHTLLYGKEIFSTGAVGVAICRSPSFINTKMDLSYDTLAPLGDSLEVTQ